MVTDQEIKQRILLLMRDRMMQLGYSKVTIDELAEELGISKKTVYKFFSGKDDLALQAIRLNFFEIEAHFAAIAASTDPFVVRLGKILSMMRERLGKVSPIAIQDIRRHVPQLWTEIETLRREHILTKLESMVLQAREEGVLRPDVDERILVKILLAAVEAVANPEMLGVLQLPMHEILHSIFHIIFEGAFTETARERMGLMHDTSGAHPMVAQEH